MIRRFPKALTAIGWIVVIPSVILAARLVWEQTVWTLNSGPQMVGFSLMHSGVGILLLLALWGGIVWIAVVAAFMLLSRSFGAALTIGLVVAYAAAWALVSTPYGFWQRMFVDKLARTPRAAEFVQYAAALGDLKTVEAFVSEGVSVDARDDRGATPLHAAAVGGQLAVAEYLVAKSADVNAINRYGDSPLENALSEGRTDVARFLESRGAQRIRGSAELRDRATSEIVREQIERMDGKAPKQ
jgi:Ankyrin repeats (3 copies)